MKVEGLPANGCNYFSNKDSFTNYYNGTARTFIILEGKAIQTRTSSYTTLPTGYICVDNNDIIFKPDFLVWSQVASIFLCGLISILLWKTLGRILGR